MEKKEKEDNYVYFIESHEKKEIAKLYFMKKYSEVDNLEIAYEIVDNPDYDIFIYRFKLLNQNIKKKLDKIDITIKLEDKETYKFEKRLTNIKLNQNNFLFDFQFEKSQFIFVINVPPKSLKLSHIDQFIYYLNYLRNKLKCDKNSVENNHLISSIQKILEEDEEYDFISYLLIFKECSSSSSIQAHLNLFKQNKIKPKKDVNKILLIELKELVDSWEKNPDILLSKIENNQEGYKIKLFSIIFYFNYNYYNERLKILLNDKIIYKGLINSYKLYCLNIPKEYMKNFMEIVVDFNQLNIIFRFNSKVYELLDIIKEYIDKIISLFLDELKKNTIYKDKKQIIDYPYIDFGNFVIQDENDYLTQITSHIKYISQKIVNKTNYFFIKFNPSFYEKYMDIFYKKNLYYLYIIKESNKFMKTYDESFGIKKNIKRYIHDTGIELCKLGKMNNMEILDFVKKDDFFLPNTSFIKGPTSADIFSKLNVRSMDDDFLKEYKKVKWEVIYGEGYLRFAKKIIDLIKHVNDLGLLYELLNISELNKSNDDLLIMIQNHYIDLYNSIKETYKNEDCPNFIIDSAKLVYFSDKLGKNIEIFLGEKIEKNLKEELINDIYSKVLGKYNKLSKVAENQIVHFFLNRKKEKVQSYFLLYLLDICKNSKDQILSHFINYRLTKEDIFSIKESENIKLLHHLLTLTAGEYLKDKLLSKYIESNENFIDEITHDIDNYNIKYKDIKHFFADIKSEIIFKDKLLIVYLLDGELQEKKFQMISERFHKVTDHINDFKLLIEDQKFYFENSYNIDINKINSLILKIEENDLNFCENNEEIIGYDSFIKDAKERTIKRKSDIYKAIYEKERGKYPKNDKKSLDSSNTKFEQYKLYLTCQKIDHLDEEFKEIIKSLNFNDEKINKEVDNLMEIFGRNDISFKNKLTNSLISLSYRNQIIKLLSSVKKIIEITKAKKEYLSNLIDTIFLYLEKSEIISTIQFSIQILKIYSINIFDQNSKFNRILIKLFDHPESIRFLLGVTLDDLKKIKEKIKDNKIINNFNQIIQFVQIFEKKDEISKMKDKELIKKIQKEINEKYENNTQSGDEQLEMILEIDDIIRLQT